MSDDIQTQATVDIDPAIRGIRQLRQEYSALGVEIRKTNSASRDLQKSTKVDGLGKNAAKGAGAAAKVGGPAGGAIGSIGGNLGTDSVFGRIAVVASVIAVAGKLLSAAVRKTAEDAAETQRRVGTINQSLLAAWEKRGQQALAAAGNTQSRAHLLAAGGSGAVEDAQMLAESGFATSDQAYSGLTHIYGRLGRGKRGDNVASAAFDATAAGVPFDVAAQELTQNANALSDPATTELIVARLVKKYVGRVRGNPKDILDEAKSAIAADSVTQAGIETRGILARGNRSAEKNLIEVGAGAARKQVSEIANPEAAVMLNIYKENQKQTAILQASVDALRDARNEKTFLSHPISNTTLRFAEFFANQRLFKEARIQSEAIFRAKEYP